MTTPTTVQVQIQLRADTAANWTAEDPVLLAAEVGLETDTKKLKVGDGTTAWTSLAYFPSIVTGGTVLGNLEIGTTGTLTFEGSTADGFETTLAVTNPTADRMITLPDQSGTVVVSSNLSRVNFGSSEVVFNETGEDYDFRIEGDTQANLFFVDASTNRVGIGTASPSEKLDIANGVIRVINATVPSSETDGAAYFGKITGGAEISQNGFVAFRTAGQERARIDSSGRLLVGTPIGYLTSTSATTQPLMQIHSTNTHESQVSINSWATGTATGANLSLCRSDSGTVGTHTVVGSTDTLGSVRFSGSDGDQFIEGASISASADGTWGNDDGPTKLVFSTTADGASSPTPRMTIKSDGKVNFSNVAVYADNAAATSGGLAVGDVYRTSTGQLMIRY